MIEYKPINPHKIRILNNWDSKCYKDEDISREIEINPEEIKNNPKSPINRIGKIKDWDEER